MLLPILCSLVLAADPAPLPGTKPLTETGDLAERVLTLVKLLDSDEFTVREKAQKELEGMGQAAYVHLVRLRKSPDLPLEVRKRIDALLEKWDARQAFPG